MFFKIIKISCPSFLSSFQLINHCLDSPPSNPSWDPLFSHFLNSLTTVWILLLWTPSGIPCNCCCSVAKSCLTLCDRLDCSIPCYPIFHYLLSWLKLMSIELVMPSNHLIFCCPLLLLPSGSPSIRVFFKKSALSIRGPKCWNWFPLGLTGLISLLSKRLSWVFSSTTFQKQQFFSTQPSLWSKSQIHTWLQEKSQLWLSKCYITAISHVLYITYITAKWCLFFLICCLGLS